MTVNRNSIVSLDFETASTVDLRKTGVAPYAKHRDTRVLCLAYAFDNDEPLVWQIGCTPPHDLLNFVAHGGRVNAWNAAFEFHVWNDTFLRQLNLTGRELNLSQLHCSMVAAAYHGLPLSLDKAASAARVNAQKDKEGQALMMRMNKPRATCAKTGVTTWWHEDEPEKLDRLCDYCVDDVKTERAVKAVVPDLPPSERDMWIIDQKINARGIGVDLVLIGKLKELATEGTRRLNVEMDRLTASKVRTVTSVGALFEYLVALGYPYPDLTKGTVAFRLSDPECKGLERRVLELRAEGARTSTAKLAAMVHAAMDPVGGVGTVRGMLQFYAAFRTGRWGGRLIQLQNMPRGVISGAEIATAADTIARSGSGTSGLVDAIELLYGPVLGVVSSLLRACLRARPGKTLTVADFAQIEARVLAWLAGERKILAAFMSGEDVYILAAADIFGIPASAVTKDQRQIGKVAVLALGFGGGKGAFATMAANYGVVVAEARAEEIKTAWRDANKNIVAFWHALERGFRAALADPSKIHQVGPYIKIAKWQSHIIVSLPSGRALVYREAQLLPHPDNPTRDELSYMGMNQYTQKWERVRTYGGKLAENVTQAVARDCMAHAIKRAEADGIEVLLTVHDELIAEAPIQHGQAKLDQLLAHMSLAPAWAPGLPVAADGWHGIRYRK
jgi:DNA polymerase